MSKRDISDTDEQTLERTAIPLDMSKTACQGGPRIVPGVSLYGR